MKTKEKNSDAHDTRDWLAVSAPMVRYSKLPFRLLVKKYSVDLAYTPMIMADSFIASSAARNQEFCFSEDSLGDVVQFAANDPHIFTAAAKMISPYCSGVDLNCGCPQRWALKEGVGAALLKDSELMYQMIRSSVQELNIPVSVKIRISENIKLTLEIVRRVEAAGVSRIAMHGRTPQQKSSDPVDYEAIKLVKEQAKVPIFANGDIFTLQDAVKVQSRTNVDGVMAARGLLVNPALFHPIDIDRRQLAAEYLEKAIAYGTSFHTIHHHTIQMLTEAPLGAGCLPLYLHKHFKSLSSISGIIDFLNNYK